MRRRNIIVAATVFVLFSVWVLALSEYAGNTDPTNPPGSISSYTLEDIYNRLNAGTTGSPSTFTEPTSGPGSTMYTLNDIMDEAPVADNTDGATKAEVADCVKYWSLRTDGSGGSGWGLETGTAPQYIAKTGIRGCWDGSGTPISCTGTGQDGEYRNGDLPVVAPSSSYSFGGYNRSSFKCYDGTAQFTDNGNGTVTDNLTGLIWLKDASCSDIVGVTGMADWTTALSAANALAHGTCGLSDGSGAGDWRLPNINELRSLFDPGLSRPFLPGGHPFTGVKSNVYWSSTTSTDSEDSAWYVDNLNGLIYVATKDIFFYVWPVRGGE